MLMSVMIVVPVSVSMTQESVLMVVSVTFREVEPDAKPHQDACNEYLGRHRFPECHYRDRGTDERCRRKIGARPRGADVA